MADAALVPSQDSWVNQVAAYASTNYGSSPAAYIKTASGANAYAYLLFTGIPTGPNVQIASATLRLRPASAWSGSATIGVRRVTSSWTQSRIKYSAQPTNTATGAGSQAVSTVAAGGIVDIDVTTIVAAWAAGTANYGFRVDNSTSTLKKFFTRDTTTASLRPQLLITHYVAGEQPTALIPDNSQQVSIARPMLTWQPDDDPRATQSAYQLQMNATDVWTSPSYDTETAFPGGVPSSLAQHTMTFDITSGSSLYWRVRTKGAGGTWSSWSDSALFGRTNKSALTITAPTGTTTDSSPTTTWTFGGTQTKWWVGYVDPDNAGAFLVTSDWQDGTDLDWASTTAIDAQYGGTRTVKVRVEDNVDRVATPGDPTYTEATATFTYSPGATANATSLTATTTTPPPAVLLQWQRSTAPDEWVIWRDDKEVARFVGTDLLVSGTSYQYSYPEARGYVQHTYKVIASNNGINATSPPSVTATLRPPYIWLFDLNDPSSFWIPLASNSAKDPSQVSLQMVDDSEITPIRDSDRQQLIFAGRRGYEGTITGIITDNMPFVGGATAQQLRDKLQTLKARPTQAWRLMYGDLNIPVVVRNVTYSTRPTSGDGVLTFDVSMEVYQQGGVGSWTFAD